MLHKAPASCFTRARIDSFNHELTYTMVKSQLDIDARCIDLARMKFTPPITCSMKLPVSYTSPEINETQLTLIVVVIVVVDDCLVWLTAMKSLHSNNSNKESVNTNK